MNTAASCSKPVRTVMFNDFRRFWVLSLAEFLVLFLATTSVIIINYSNPASVSEYIKATMDMSNMFMTGAVCIFAVLAAVVVFRYMHLVNATAVCHSLPVTRGQLYAGHLLSGYLLAAVPVIVNAIILMLIAKPVYYDANMYYSAAADALKGRDMFTAKSVLVTALLLLLIMLFVYVVSVFAGMLCGTSVMHVIGAFGLNALVPALLAFICEYAQLFLYGFSTSSSMLHVIKLSSPILGITSMRTGEFPNSDSVNIVPVIVYILVSAAIAAAGYFLYRQRKLENATEPLVFKFMIPVVCGLITFFASTIIGLFAGEENRFFIWFISGTVIFYILSRMLALKTTRVFNRSTFRALGIYIVTIAVFISVFAFDVTGYENRIPAEDNIRSASTDILAGSGNRLIHGAYNNQPAEFTSKENIENVIALHKELLSQKPSAVISGVLDYTLGNTSSDCSYRLKNGHTVKRCYNLSDDFIMNSEALKAIYESAEYKDISSLYNSDMLKDLSKVSLALCSNISEEASEKNNWIAINPAQTEELVEAMEKDFRARTFEEELLSNISIGEINISQSAPDKYGYYAGDYSTIPVLGSDKNTISWLKKHGYYSKIDPSEYTVKNASVYSDSDGSTTDVTGILKGKTLSDILEAYKNTSISDFSAQTFYQLELDLKFKGSAKTYVYTISYSENTLPDDFRKALSE